MRPSDGNRWPPRSTALPGRERDTLLLQVWESLSYDGVALALGVPVGTVRSRLNRARGRLRELGEPSGREQGEEHRRASAGRIGP